MSVERKIDVRYQQRQICYINEECSLRRMVAVKWKARPSVCNSLQRSTAEGISGERAGRPASGDTGDWWQKERHTPTKPMLASLAAFHLSSRVWLVSVEES